MEQPTQFKVVKKAVMEALKAGAYQHEARSSIDVKNLLATGEVSAAEVMTLLTGSEYFPGGLGEFGTFGRAGPAGTVDPPHPDPGRPRRTAPRKRQRRRGV